MKQKMELSHLTMHRTIWLMDYIGWTNGLTDYQSNGLGLWLGVQ